MNTKKNIISLLLSFICICAAGENRSDRFMTYSDMAGHQVKLYNAGTQSYMLAGIAYDRNYKKIPNSDLSRLSAFMTVKGTKQYNGKSYLQVDVRGEVINLLLDGKFDFKGNIRSVDYWKSKFTDARTCGYIKSDSYLLPESVRKSCARKGEITIPVVWAKDFSMPKWVEDDVVFGFCVSDGIPVKLNASEWDFFKKDFSVKNGAEEVVAAADSYDEMEKNRVYPARVDRAAISSDVLDKVHGQYHFYEDKEFVEKQYEKSIPFSVYAVDKDKCYGVFGGGLLSVDCGAVKFNDAYDLDYLIVRGMENVEVRKKSAIQHDETALKTFLSDVANDYRLYELYCQMGDYARAKEKFPQSSYVKEKLKEQEKLRKEKQRERDCLRKYGPEWGPFVYRKEYRLGMTTGMCYDIAGSGAYEVNMTVREGLVTEHWTLNRSSLMALGGSLFGVLGAAAAGEVMRGYPSSLYFVNGKLVEIEY